MSPLEICVKALQLKGVPSRITDGLYPGILTDVWVQLVVMENVPWQQVEARIDKAREEVLTKERV
jgi:hypothetical protein